MNITPKIPLTFLFDDYGQPIQGKPAFIEAKGANMVSEAFWQTPCAFYLGVEPYYEGKPKDENAIIRTGKPRFLPHNKPPLLLDGTFHQNPNFGLGYKINFHRLYCLCTFNDANQKQLYTSFNHLINDLLANLFNFGLCDIHATREISFKDEASVIRCLRMTLTSWCRFEGFDVDYYKINEGLVMGEAFKPIDPRDDFSLIYIVYDSKTQTLKPALIYKPNLLIKAFDNLDNVKKWKAQCANPLIPHYQKIHQLSPVLPRLIHLTEMFHNDLTEIETWLNQKLIQEN